jgi:hypothetical protein
VVLMKNRQLDEADYMAEIRAAKAAIWQGRRLPPAPETFDLFCFCAVHDKPYTLRFERQPSGLVRFKESMKSKPSSLPDNARAGSGGGWTMHQLKYFENAATPCAWCGNKDFHYCALDCGALVCGGRMKGNTFHCRESCGASWVGVPMLEVRGTVNRQSRECMTAPARGSLQPSHPAVGAGHHARLLLPAGKGGKS